MDVIGVQFFTKQFDINVQIAKSLFSNLGKRGDKVNIYEKLTESFFIANIKLFLGNNAFDKIKEIKGLYDIETGEL